MNRTFTSKDGRYTFDEAEHIHTLDGGPLHGVTTVLRVIAKPALIQWAANMACDYIDAVRIEGKPITLEIIKEARVAHRKKKESAGDWGTEVHAETERYIKDCMERGGLADSIQVGRIQKFQEWAVSNKVKFLESEKHVWSQNLWVGGILDMVFEMDGKKYIGDVKTSSGIYNEAFFQMAAYQLCLEEMGEAEGIAGYVVINLKKDGTMDLKMATDMELNKTAFKAALELHKIINVALV